MPEQTQQVAVRDKEIHDERLIHYYCKTEKKVYVFKRIYQKQENRKKY